MEGLLDQWLWKEEYWLPPGVTWKDIEMEGDRYPLPRDLFYTLPLALGFIVLRYVFERVIAMPLSRQLGVRDRVRVRALPVPKLETFYKQNKQQPSQPVAEAHYWYYITELGFYWSLLLCVSVDVKRKDFKEQIIHHIATIFLIGFSYCANYVRVGTLVILVHDSSDFLLESAKMFNYAGWRKTCDTLFVIFALVFLLTRLVVFPGRIVHSTLVVSLDFFQPFFGYYFFNALLLVLQALHIFWAWLILRMVYKFVFMGKVEKDERSDEESEPEEEVEAEEEEETSWEQRKGALNSKLASLANNCVLNNLTNQRNMNSRLPKAR
ncbi:ceramide synthase 2 isoform X2 [Coregonus clupeaformis]|uniref:ceramide synthase 2 isoform X2 n=1 Tax=Coregonus clupeaformis TaxID=59861 RepID=UPI001BDFB93C|nr:ceramide synthase 2 isoform X2 [Coregonus clupeaformis]